MMKKLSSVTHITGERLKKFIKLFAREYSGDIILVNDEFKPSVYKYIDDDGELRTRGCHLLAYDDKYCYISFSDEKWSTLYQVDKFSIHRLVVDTGHGVLDCSEMTIKVR